MIEKRDVSTDTAQIAQSEPGGQQHRGSPLNTAETAQIRHRSATKQRTAWKEPATDEKSLYVAQKRKQEETWR